MFLIYGIKETEKKLGFVAEYCPQCNAVRAVEVYRINLVNHFYRIPLGKGQFIDAYGKCGACDNKIQLELANYASISTTKDLELNQLIFETNPHIGKDGSITNKNAQRLVDILRLFLKHGASLNKETYTETKFDKTSGLAFLATFTIPLVLGSLVPYIPLSTNVELMIMKSLYLLFTLGMLLSFYIFLKYPMRLIKNQVLPKILEDIKPYDPTELEINMVFERLDLYGYRICKYIKASDVVEVLISSKYGIASELR